MLEFSFESQKLLSADSVKIEDNLSYASLFSNKLSALLVLEKNQEVKDKLGKAIVKVNTDNFDILNYYELKNLNKSLNE